MVKSSLRRSERIKKHRKTPINIPFGTYGEYIGGIKIVGQYATKRVVIKHAQNLVEEQLNKGAKNVDGLLKLLNDQADLSLADNDEKFMRSFIDDEDRVSIVIARVIPNAQYGNHRGHLPGPIGYKHALSNYHNRGHLAAREFTSSSSVDTLENIITEHAINNQGFKRGFEIAIGNYIRKNQGKFFTGHVLHYRDHDHKYHLPKVSKKPRRITHIFFTREKILAALTINNSTRHLGGKNSFGV